ncbi:MAG: asparagine synthase-related protein [Aminobacterium colombiense]|nr:asparagine synthase-related protein [Aminobacterium colombiense]
MFKRELVGELSYTILKKYLPDAVIKKLKQSRRCVVSFSGGIDSAVVVAIMASLMAPEDVHAAMFRSFLHFPEEMERGGLFCHSLGVTLHPLPGPELDVDEVMNNSSERCRFCKKARGRELLEFAKGIEADLVLEGSNADDLKDATRLGTKVLKEMPQIYSPLAEGGLSKDKVRTLAKELDISWWDEQATACLATRFPEGHPLAAAECSRVARAEWALRKAGFSQVRIKVLGAIACLQVPQTLMEQALMRREEILEIGMKEGFHHLMLDLQGYEWGRKWIEEKDLSGRTEHI